MLLFMTDATSAAGTGASIFPMIIVWVILGLFLYFVPTIVAYKSNHLNKKAILLLNIFLGWTIVGWVVALVMSVWKTSKPSN